MKKLILFGLVSVLLSLSAYAVSPDEHYPETSIIAIGVILLITIICGIAMVNLAIYAYKKREKEKEGTS